MFVTVFFTAKWFFSWRRRAFVIFPRPVERPNLSELCPLPDAAGIITTYLPERLANIKVQIEALQEHCFLSKVIVWNNNPQHDLIIKHSLVQVVNQKTNIGTTAKYEACVMSGLSACFIIDDDWLPIHVPRLYSIFLAKNFKVPVVLTDPITQHMDECMSFRDELGHHFGFSWLGVGSFISHDMAAQFLEYSRTLIPAKFALHSDVFFTILSNTIPLTLSGNIIPLASNGDTRRMSAAKGYEMFLEQARRSAFELGVHLPVTNTAEEDDNFIDVKAICDDGILIINNDHFTRDHAFLQSTSAKTFTRVDTWSRRLSVEYPFISVCGNSCDTAYRPLGELSKGRYFGYIFVKPTSLAAFEITLRLPQSLEITATDFQLDFLDRQSGSWEQVSLISALSSVLSEESTNGVRVLRLMYIFSVRKVVGVRVRAVNYIPTFNEDVYICEMRTTAGHDVALPILRETSSLGLSLEEVEVCGEEIFLFVAVTTAAGSRQRRDIIRNTLMELATHDGRVKLMFALSRSQDLSILQEAEVYKDIFLLDSLESYDTLSDKSLKIFQWVTLHCRSTDYFMKIDDDSFVQFKPLLEKLMEIQTKFVYMGHIFTNQEVYHDKKEKNYEPYFDGKFYPPYASGSGYIMSSDLLRYISSRQHEVDFPGWKLIRNEDAALGLWLTGLNVSLIHAPDFFPEPPAECRSDAILLHRQSDAAFIHYFDSLLKHGNICA